VAREARFAVSLLEGMVRLVGTELVSRVGEEMVVLEVLGAVLGDEPLIQSQSTSKSASFSFIISLLNS